MKDNEENYLSLLREKQLANDIYNEKIKKVKKKINKEFIKVNKNIILMLDIMMIIVILFNLGAVVTTNILVVKVEPEIKILEANPEAAKLHNYEAHPQGREIMNAIMRKMFMWTLFIFLYILSSVRS